MATAISAANFAAALGECQDAVAASNWASARSWLLRAQIQHAGLMATITDQGQTQTRQTGLDKISKAIDDTEAAANQGTDDERRIIKTRTGFGS